VKCTRSLQFYFAYDTLKLNVAVIVLLLLLTRQIRSMILGLRNVLMDVMDLWCEELWMILQSTETPHTTCHMAPNRIFAFEKKSCGDINQLLQKSMISLPGQGTQQKRPTRSVTLAPQNNHALFHNPDFILTSYKNAFYYCSCPVSMWCTANFMHCTTILCHHPSCGVPVMKGSTRTQVVRTVRRRIQGSKHYYRQGVELVNNREIINNRNLIITYNHCWRY